MGLWDKNIMLFGVLCKCCLVQQQTKYLIRRQVDKKIIIDKLSVLNDKTYITIRSNI